MIAIIRGYYSWIRKTISLKKEYQLYCNMRHCRPLSYHILELHHNIAIFPLQATVHWPRCLTLPLQWTTANNSIAESRERSLCSVGEGWGWADRPPCIAVKCSSSRPLYARQTKTDEITLNFLNMCRLT